MPYYATKSAVVALSNGQVTSDYIQDDWVVWNDYKVDTLLNLGFSFRLYKDQYSFILSDTTVREIFLRSPLVADDTYLFKLFEDGSAYPTTSDTETSSDDYMVRRSFIEKIRDSVWEKYITIEYHWGFPTVPKDVEVLANLTLLNFCLLSKQSSSSSVASERIGEYQFSSTSVETTTSSFSDEIDDLISMVKTKYSTVNFTFPGIQNPSPTLINSSSTEILNAPV